MCALSDLGKMVYSKDGSGKGLYGTDGKMVYKYIANGSSADHAYRRKIGDYGEISTVAYPDEDLIMAEAESIMQAAEWGSVNVMFKNQTQHSTLTSPTRYRTRCICEMGGRCYQIGALTGFTLDSIRVNVTNSSGLTIRIKVLTQSVDTWPSWSDASDDAQYVGTGTGDIDVTVGFVADTHVKIFVVADPVVAPTPPAGDGSTTEQVTWNNTVTFYASSP
jgi:hypothetical protein